MTALRRLAALQFWAGVGILVFALVMAARAFTMPATGFEDLAAIVGAMFLVAISGLVFGAFLWLARVAGRPYPAVWRLAVASVGALLALVSAIAMGDVAREAPNWGLLAFVLAAVVLSVGGLYSAGRMLRAKAV